MPPKTTVNAKAGGTTVKGRSSSGRHIGTLLSGSRNPDAQVFLAALENIKRHNPPRSRSPFSCAEPHAFALLLAKGARLEDIEIVGMAKQNHLDRTIMECPNCSQWLFNGRFCEPGFADEASPAETRRSSDLSDHEDFVYDEDDFPELGGSSSASASASASTPAAASDKP